MREDGCVNIVGATAKTYTPTSTDVDNTLRVSVTASNASGQASSTSKPSLVVSSNAAPKNTVRPSISGTTQVGEELTADPGTWTGGVRSFTIQWQRCDSVGANCFDVLGATGRTYGVRAADKGHTLRVNVTATNAVDSTSITSDRTDVITAVPAPQPVVNHRPTIVVLSARFIGPRLYARFRICDDSQQNLVIIVRGTKLGVGFFTRRFATLTRWRTTRPAA